MTDTDPRCEKCGNPRSNHLYRHPFVGPSQADTIKAIAAKLKEVEAERDAAMREALFLATTLHSRHYSEVTQWEPLDYPAGVISQIDNMVAGIVARAEAALPAAYRLGYTDAKKGRMTDVLLTEPTPTAADLLARIAEERTDD